VHVRVDSLDESLDGRVEHISPRTEFTPRFLFSEQERPNLVIRARIRVDDPEERLRAGVPAFVSMVER
jgi:HlyD family secretion protein